MLDPLQIVLVQRAGGLILTKPPVLLNLRVLGPIPLVDFGVVVRERHVAAIGWKADSAGVGTKGIHNKVTVVDDLFTLINKHHGAGRAWVFDV